MMDYDVIIAGASFGGLAAANALVGKRVLLVDRKPIGAGQTSACGTLYGVIEALDLHDSLRQVHPTIVLHTPHLDLTYHLAFAPHMAHVIATDLTEEMLSKTAELVAERGLANLETRIADAELLPFENASFDLVTCRLAFHHFPNPRQAVGEFARVLKPGGVLGFADNVVVPDKGAAGYYNAYEKLRDPSHHWVYPLACLQAMFEETGLQVRATRRLSKEFEFHAWADRQRASDAVKAKLLDMMRSIPPALDPLFAPRWDDGTMYFSLWEAVILAKKSVP
jgi:SAM-dependent methyltransferase